MTSGLIPGRGTIVEEVRRLGFEPTEAQVRWLEADVADELQRFGEELGKRMQIASHAIQRASRRFERALYQDFEDHLARQRAAR